MRSINLVIPAKEKEEHINLLIKRIVNIPYIKKIIIVIEKEKKITNFSHKKKILIVNQKISGYGAAIKYGFSISKSKYTCIYNADGSFNYKDLKSMIQKTKKNDFVFASRYLKNAGSEDDTFLTYLGNFIFSLLGKFLLKINLSDILYTYVLCDTNKFNNLKIYNNDFRFCVELPYKISRKNFKYCSIPSKEFKRQYGKKNVNEFKDGFLILLEILKLAFFKK